MLEITITNEQKIPVTVVPVTAVGNPIGLDGSVSVTVQTGDSTFTLLSATEFELVSSDTPGDTVYLVEADADLGDGVETIADIVTLHVAGAKATSLGLVAGTAVAK